MYYVIFGGSARNVNLEQQTGSTDNEWFSEVVVHQTNVIVEQLNSVAKANEVSDKAQQEQKAFFHKYVLPSCFTMAINIGLYLFLSTWLVR